MPFHHIHVDRPTPRLDDVAAETDRSLAACGVELPVRGEVAIALGSRGIGSLVTVVGRVIEWIRAAGATPVIIPAMGSHGGATAEGQREVLEAYGLGALGVEIRSSMEVVALPGGDSAIPVVTDATAAGCAATVLVNRVKPHTDFHGRYESGLFKMAAIGLGNQVQAEALHAYGTYGLRELMPEVGRAVLVGSNIVAGVAIVENSRDEPLRIEAIAAAAIARREPELLELARAHLPRLPVDELDVLLVDRMGKDISGVGIDTNVIGRIMINGEPDPPAPRISMIGCHRLTAASHGNACGMGLADVIPQSFADAIDQQVTATNIVTSGFLLRGKTPLVAPDDRRVWEWCCRGAGVRDIASVRAARIVDTLHCDELWVSDAVLAQLVDDPTVTVVASDVDLHDDSGSLRPFH